MRWFFTAFLFPSDLPSAIQLDSYPVIRPSLVLALTSNNNLSLENTQETL